jgi:hypothetical protein
VSIERIHLSVEPGIVVPLVLLVPAQPRSQRVPVVVALAQGGKQEFLRQRAEPIAALLRGGIAVALPDLRGTGETSPGEGRDRRSPSTSHSATALMLGETLVGARLRDLRSVLRHLRQRPQLDPNRIALWGDALTPPNPNDRDWKVPHGAANRPATAEPLGGLLALLGALFEEEIGAVLVHGGMDGYLSAFEGPFCYLPHDAVIPGVLTVGDVSDLAASLAPRPLRMQALVNGLNRAVSAATLEENYAPAQSAYRSAKAPDRLVLRSQDAPLSEAVDWLADQIKRD